MEKIFISITLLPEKKVNLKILELNKIIGKKVKIELIDYNDTDFAHISLYNATFPSYNKEKIKNNLEELFKNIKPLILKPKKINLKNQYISILFKKNININNLQKLIISNINNLRDNMIQSKYLEQKSYYSKKELLNVKKYGYPFCKSEFNPHLTICKIKNINDGKKIINEIDWNTEILIKKISIKMLFTDKKGNKHKKIIYFKI